MELFVTRKNFVSQRTQSIRKGRKISLRSSRSLRYFLKNQ